jgi:hypothetical protein
MQTLIRKEGLQIDAILNMGNSLYAILLATVIGMAGILIKTDELFIKSTEVYSRCISGGVFVLLLIYYLIDWYDLNLAPYFDKKIGLAQMAKWMLCIIIVTLSSLMALSGQINIVGLLTGFYMAPVMCKRDKEIGVPKGTMEIGTVYWKGVADACLMITKWGLVMLSLVIFSLTFIHFCFEWTPGWFNTSVAIMTISCWLVALGYKIVRSHFLISPKYKIAIAAMIKKEE